MSESTALAVQEQSRSSSIAKLMQAFAKAQGEFENPKKDSDNPFFKSKYADLAAIVSSVRKPLADHGIAYTHRIQSMNGKLGVETTLHLDDEWLSSGVFWMHLEKSTPQSQGSAITYGKRYTLQAVLGLPSEDDDGNGSSNHRRPNGTNGRHHDEPSEPDSGDSGDPGEPPCSPEPETFDEIKDKTYEQSLRGAQSVTGARNIWKVMEPCYRGVKGRTELYFNILLDRVRDKEEGMDVWNEIKAAKWDHVMKDAKDAMKARLAA